MMLAMLISCSEVSQNSAMYESVEAHVHAGVDHVAIEFPDVNSQCASAILN